MLIVAFLSGSTSLAHQADVSLVVYDQNSPAVNHGAAKITSALDEKGLSHERVDTLAEASGEMLIIVGVAQERGEVARLLLDANVQVPATAEALAVHHTRVGGKNALLVTGSDERGVMYAALDVAKRIGWASNPQAPLSEVRNVSEEPRVVERALSKMVVNQSEFEKYCFSEEYWDQYLDMLAQDRFNTFVLMFGYASSGYFAPIYPYLFDVEGFPEVRVVGITGEKQRRNLEMLRMIIQKAHERGLDFTLALWTHISVGTSSYRTVESATPGLVWGLTDDNLIAYTEAAMTKFFTLVNEMDALQFRVHVESAVGLPDQIPFWNMIHEVIKDADLDIPISMRAKGFTDDMIDEALASGLNIRITTKYWGEQMGLPYHPTHITGFNQSKRRHGYADLLRYPKRYEMHYRLWTFGTVRLLLWGDPDYVARFAESTHLYDGEGFEVTEPLAWKMARHLGEGYDILNPEYQYYDWEYERYWHFFQVFGRVGYNPDTDPVIWRKEFEKRFGEEAAPFVEQGIHLASRILPRIVAYNLQDISADVSWAEKQRWQALPVYTNVQPSDTAQFLGIKEAAQYRLKGIDSAKIWPQETSEWFAAISDDVLELTRRAEERIGTHKNKEFDSTMRDLKILAYLALYHAQRIHAGLNYGAYEFTQDLNALDDAIKYEKKAIEVWKKIVPLTDGVYHDNLVMGWGGEEDDVSDRPYNMVGSWKTELVKLEDELDEIQQQRDTYHYESRNAILDFDFGNGTAEPGYLPVSTRTKYDRIEGGYGWEHIYAAPTPDFQIEPGVKTAVQDFVSGPRQMSYTYSSFAAEVPNGHYELKFIMVDNSARPCDYGPMWVVANGLDSTEQFTVPVGTTVEKTLRTTVTDNKAIIVFNSNSNSSWLVNSVSIRRLDPEISHVPVRKTAPGQDIRMDATVSGPDAIAQVRIRYGNSEQGYRYVSMERSEPGLYHGTIRGSDVIRDLSYYIEAEDDAGRIATCPQEGGLKPFHVNVTDDMQPPTVSHAPVTSVDVGKALTITARVDDPAGVKWVRLRYRGVNQHQDFRTLPMLPTGERSTYLAEIPATHIRPEWDLMYFIEVMDNNGNGTIYPDLEIETPYIVAELKGRDMK